MIRQAHTYLVGAMGGATLIAIAIVFFVVLVSAQVFKDWPIAALGGGGDSAVSAAQPATGTTAGGTDPDGATATALRSPGSRATREVDGSAPARGGGSIVQGDGVGTPGAGTPPPSGAGGQGQGAGSTPVGAPQATGGSEPGSGTASSGSAGGGNAPATGAGGGGSGGSGTGGGGTGTAAPPPSGQVAETVNGTVTQVDESVLGGTLDNSGVTAVTEGVVNGVAGPESTVGKVVDETVGAVGGLLHGNR